MITNRLTVFIGLLGVASMSLAATISTVPIANQNLQLRNGVTAPNRNLLPPAIPRGISPDLIVQVLNANSGLIKVKNRGNAAAGPSQLGVICSRLHSSLPSSSCGGIHQPNYLARYNTLSFAIPALRPGAGYQVRLWGAGGIPMSEKVPDTYGAKLFADWKKQVAESNENNNYTRLDVVIRGKTKPGRIGSKPDLIPLVSDPFSGVIKVKNRGAAAAGASKLAISCKKVGHTGPGGGCADSPALHALYDPSLDDLVVTIPPLAAAAVHTVYLPLKGLRWEKGRYKFSFKADATGAVAESNEGNNVKSLYGSR